MAQLILKISISAIIDTMPDKYSECTFLWLKINYKSEYPKSQSKMKKKKNAYSQ